MESYNNNSFKKRPKEINLKEVFLIIKRRFWIIILVTFLAGIAGLIQSNVKTIPLYQSSSRIIIGADEESRKTLQVIVKDSTILEKVISQLHLNKTSEALAAQITVSSVDGSQVVSISVLDPDPILAAKIADTTASIFKNEVPTIVGQDYIRLLSSAKVSSSPINQNSNNKLIIAVIGGLVVGIGIAFLFESLDNRIRSESEIEAFLGLPLLGKISKVNRRNVKKKSSIIGDLELRGETFGNE